MTRRYRYHSPESKERKIQAGKEAMSKRYKQVFVDIASLVKDFNAIADGLAPGPVYRMFHSHGLSSARGYILIHQAQDQGMEVHWPSQRKRNTESGGDTN